MAKSENQRVKIEAPETVVEQFREYLGDISQMYE